MHLPQVTTVDSYYAEERNQKQTPSLLARMRLVLCSVLLQFAIEPSLSSIFSTPIKRSIHLKILALRLANFQQHIGLQQLSQEQNRILFQNHPSSVEVPIFEGLKMSKSAPVA